MRETVRVAMILVTGIALTACQGRNAVTPFPGNLAGERPVIVQGAMDVEVRTFAASLDHVTEEKIEGWTFWRGTLDGYPVVVSKTLKGMSNAAVATALAAEHYHPAAIINQGTAGGHDAALHVYDIVLGLQVVNIGAFKTGARARGQGSDFAEWQPMDLLYSEGSAGQNPNALSMRRYPGDEGLLAAARTARDKYARGRVAEGVIGSSEIWNSEVDRIQSLHDRFGTTAEEMEAASAAQIAGMFRVPFLGIRVVSDNVMNDGAYDGKTGVACQEYVYQVVKAYVGRRLKHQS